LVLVQVLGELSLSVLVAFPLVLVLDGLSLSVLVALVALVVHRH
jgi:hypothetical protein